MFLVPRRRNPSATHLLQQEGSETAGSGRPPSLSICQIEQVAAAHHPQTNAQCTPRAYFAAHMALACASDQLPTTPIPERPPSTVHRPPSKRQRTGDRTQHFLADFARTTAFFFSPHADMTASSELTSNNHLVGTGKCMSTLKLALIDQPVYQRYSTNEQRWVREGL